MVPNSELHPQREYQVLEALRALYGEVLDDAARPLFGRLGWFEMLYAHCFAGQPLVIGQAEEGESAAILPLVARDGHLEALANYYSFSFAPIFVQANDEAVRLRLLTRIARDLRREHGRITLFPLFEEDEGTASLVTEAFRAAGWVTTRRAMAHNHILNVGGQDFASYWAGRPSPLRNSVKRKAKKLAHSIDVHHAVTDALWEDYCTIYAASWKGAESHPALLRDLAEDAARRGALRLAFLRVDGTAVATHFWTIEGDVALIHKLAHDKAYDAASPGTILAHHMFRLALDEDRVRLIDYGTGDNGYKRDWMDGSRIMWRIDCFNPRRPAQWLALGKSLISALVRRCNTG